MVSRPGGCPDEPCRAHVASSGCDLKELRTWWPAEATPRWGCNRRGATMVKNLIRFGLAGAFSLGIGVAAPMVHADESAADKAASSTQNTANEAANKADETAGKATDESKSAADKASQEAKGAGQKTDEAAGKAGSYTDEAAKKAGQKTEEGVKQG